MIEKGSNKIKYDGLFWLTKSAWNNKLEMLSYCKNVLIKSATKCRKNNFNLYYLPNSSK